MKHLRLYTAWLLALSVMACATVAPKTMEQRLAMAEGQVAAVINTAADLRREGMIDDEQYRKIDPLIDDVNTALDAGRSALAVGDLDTVQTQVELANRLLWRLRERLPNQGGNNGSGNSD